MYVFILCVLLGNRRCCVCPWCVRVLLPSAKVNAACALWKHCMFGLVDRGGYIVYVCGVYVYICVCVCVVCVSSCFART